MKIIWMPKSLEQIEMIADYIAESNPLNAQRYVSELFDRTESLLEIFPESGRFVPFITPTDLREIIHDSYRIIYHYSEECETVSILTVHSSYQNITSENWNQ